MQMEWTNTLSAPDSASSVYSQGPAPGYGDSCPALPALVMAYSAVPGECRCPYAQCKRERSVSQVVRQEVRLWYVDNVLLASLYCKYSGCWHGVKRAFCSPVERQMCASALPCPPPK